MTTAESKYYIYFCALVMSLPTKYDPSTTEDKWYAYWMEQGFFTSKPDPDKEAYTIVIPPPNVTGVLHMGHMLNNTIQDVLIRRARMQGKEALWVPGTDHASIATEAKVVAMLREKGITKNDISREEYMAHAWKWREKYGGIILEQLKKLGASCDWNRTAFTMDDEYSTAVVKVFVDLHDKGHIYRGYRMVNWDPQGKTALADDEVIHRDVQSKLYYVQYPIQDSEELVTIATTRPETILGDTAICVNPKDERYRHLKGKTALVPLIERPVPIIQDAYVDMDFGTGCLKVTPAHDANDYELGKRHNLETVDIFHDDATLNSNARLYVGEDRFVARNKIVADLEKKGHLVKVEDYSNSVGFSERTDAAIEPRLSLQWYVRMKDLTVPALENVLSDNIRLIPPKFKNTYRHWMENVRDWCISRQLWWGHRIPAFYLEGDDLTNEDTQVFVAETKSAALQKARESTGNQELTENDLVQDEDVLDTWFSSGLWPISLFRGLTDSDNEEIKYYYPTNDLVTAPEILFFWVARMIIFGYEYMGEKPFRNVYLTGIVRDAERRKMSKSLGNSPDPLVLMKKYGADGVRTGMLFSSPAGNDLLFDEKLCEQGRNFSNKVWNALRLVKGWEVDAALGHSGLNTVASEWFESRFNQALTEINDHFSKFRISDALMASYSFIWDDFCSWYLEMVKPEYQKPVDPLTYENTLSFFESVMKMLHPFMPFITEEIWHQIRDRTPREAIIVASWPEPGSVDSQLLEEGAGAFEIIGQVRNFRNRKGLSPRKMLRLVKRGKLNEIQRFHGIICKLGALEKFTSSSEEKIPGSAFVIKGTEYVVQLDDASADDPAAERESLKRELEYTRGFLTSVDKKLSNDRFINNAPEEVVKAERRKKADAEAKIKTLEIALERL